MVMVKCLEHSIMSWMRTSDEKERKTATL